jgi:hypothetical protein
LLSGPGNTEQTAIDDGGKFPAVLRVISTTQYWSDRQADVRVPLTHLWPTVSAESTPDEIDLANSPYLGLATFQPDDADQFFGRTELADELRHRIITESLSGGSFRGLGSIPPRGDTELLLEGM